jgi:hypothetical protein
MDMARQSSWRADADYRRQGDLQERANGGVDFRGVSKELHRFHRNRVRHSPLYETSRQVGIWKEAERLLRDSRGSSDDSEVQLVTEREGRK